MRVLLDANALMMPVQFGVDVLEEIRWLIGSYILILQPQCPDKAIGRLYS